MSRLKSCMLGAAALSLLFSMNAAAATLAQQCGAFGIVTYDPEPKTGYEAWAEANGITGAWNGTSGGIHNVFRYVFDKPTGSFENPALIDIAIEGANAVVKTPPVANTAGYAVSVVESSDVAGETVTATKPLDATGRTEFATGSAASRFYRLSATPGDAE